MEETRRIQALVFSGHALRQMFARDLSAGIVRAIVEHGETIMSYPDDQPYPSELILGFAIARPVHVVLAYNEGERVGYVVTAYCPDPKLWSDDFKSRR